MQKPPLAQGRSLMVLEVDADKAYPRQWVRVTVSRPGREGTFTRTWPMIHGQLDEPTAADLYLWLRTTLDNALIDGLSGLQQVLNTGTEEIRRVTRDSLGVYGVPEASQGSPS